MNMAISPDQEDGGKEKGHTERTRNKAGSEKADGLLLHLRVWSKASSGSLLSAAVSSSRHCCLQPNMALEYEITSQ